MEQNLLPQAGKTTFADFMTIVPLNSRIGNQRLIDLIILNKIHYSLQLTLSLTDRSFRRIGKKFAYQTPSANYVILFGE